jgi:hypothetical protein
MLKHTKFEANLRKDLAFHATEIKLDSNLLSIIKKDIFGG